MLIGLLGTEVSVNKQELERGPALYLFQVPWKRLRRHYW